MRTIDADALYASIAKDTYILADRINSKDYGMFLIGIKEKIDNAPTIEPSGDLISRFDIDCLLTVAQDVDDITLDECNKFCDLLDRVPSVSAVSVEDAHQISNLLLTKEYMRGRKDGEPKRGEWITTKTWNHDGEPYCSNCDFAPYDDRDALDFCPNCGAKMGETK